jgi:propanol-preferring alcohol dehydrogenase
MAKMTAFQLVEWGKPPEFVDVEVPRPAPGEVLVKVAGVGLCHTDLHFLDDPPGSWPYAVPFTLGHENAGWVESLGGGVEDLSVGAPVAVVSIHSCGACSYCLRGQDNYCALGTTGRGYGEDGGLASYLVAPRRELIPLQTLDPVRVGPLTDAGATPYHAVKKVLPKLVPGSTAVVIGAGGLGGYAVQYLRRLTAAQVIAVDLLEARREQVLELGASAALASDGSTVEEVRRLTGGAGAAAVLDFVGSDATMAMALACGQPMGSIGIVGAGGGTARVAWDTAPLECEVFIPMGAPIAEVREVIAMAEAGELRMDTELFPFERTAEAYELFRSGELSGRAVVMPNS